jgi:hypothetical protein
MRMRMMGFARSPTYAAADASRGVWLVRVGTRYRRLAGADGGARCGRWRGWVFICEGTVRCCGWCCCKGGGAGFEMMLSPLASGWVLFGLVRAVDMGR